MKMKGGHTAMDTSVLLEEEQQKANEEECRRKAEELDRYFKRSAALNSTPMRSGIGWRAFVSMVRDGMSSDQSEDE
jgi:hypothetical protein